MNAREFLDKKCLSESVDSDATTIKTSIGRMVKIMEEYAQFKAENLPIFGVSEELFLAILDKYQVECQLQYNTGTVPDAREWFAKNYSH